MIRFLAPSRCRLDPPLGPADLVPPAVPPPASGADLFPSPPPTTRAPPALEATPPPPLFPLPDPATPTRPKDFHLGSLSDEYDGYLVKRYALSDWVTEQHANPLYRATLSHSRRGRLTPVAADLFSKVIDPSGVCVTPTWQDILELANNGVVFEAQDIKVDAVIMLVCKPSVFESDEPTDRVATSLGDKPASISV